MSPARKTVLLLMMTCSAGVGCWSALQNDVVGPVFEARLASLGEGVGQTARSFLSSQSEFSDSNAASQPDWPPTTNQPYPDLRLRDQNGDWIQLSQFKGRRILVELVAIPCAGCQAFAGGNRHGGFAGVRPQTGLGSIHEYAQQFGHVTLGKDVVFVQLVLYGKSMNAPTQNEVSSWAQHFGMRSQNGEIVLQGTQAMLGPKTYAMIPGFHLIDRNFILRHDSSGHSPKDDLYRELLPAIRRL